jgi:Domain of unknown function (DUF4333)
MTAMSRSGRILTAVAIGALALAACTDPVRSTTLAKVIMDQLQKQNIDAENVICPGDLRAAVGETERCTFTVDGQPVDAIATVTSIDGSHVAYDITTEARPIAKDLLARKVMQQVTQQAGKQVDSTTCKNDLQPMLNASAGCTLVMEGKPMDVTVVVTGVNGGRIYFSIKKA